MSLNGLDSAAIVEAYQSALADAGGWDEVALLERGSGGVSEVRNAIEKYEETSPLYGFLQYRRRKVILRYMPEGLSRLILARSNVQFQSVLDRFSPNDTTLVLTQASDLNESALSSACLLHTASGSITSSSSSLRRRKLMEITEDAEENGAPKKTEAPNQPPLQVPAQAEIRERPGSQRSELTIVPPTTSSSFEAPPDLRSPSPRPPQSREGSRPPPSRDSRCESRQSMAPTSPASSERARYRNILDEFPRPSEEARMSTQSGRPSLRELERAAGYTPKVKLGPRPSLDQTGQPRTSGSSQNPDQRPVASRPECVLRLLASSSRWPKLHAHDLRGSSFASRPSTRVPPIPPLLVPPPTIPVARPPISPGAKSLGALSTSSGLTPEKERLMKALQQRKKNMAKRAEDSKKRQAAEPLMKDTIPDIPIDRTQVSDENKENVNLAPETENEETTQQIPETHPAELPSTAFQPILDRSLEEKPEETTQGDCAPVEDPAEPLSSLEEPAEDLADTKLYLQPRAFSGFYTAPQLPPDEPLEPIEPLPTHREGELDVASAELQQESTPDVPSPDSDRGASSHASRPSADTTFSNASGDAFDCSELDTPQTTLEDDTGGFSTIPNHAEAKKDLAAPSAPSGVPLSEVPGPVPDSELEGSSSPLETLGTVTDQSDASSEQTPQEPLDSANGLVTPPPESPSPSATETPIAHPPAPIDPIPAEETSAKEQPTGKPDAVPLDQRRKVYLEPIQISTQEYSDDDNLLSDDSFMEELRSATVQEARPVAVKSPSVNSDQWRGSPRAFSSSHGSRSPSVMQTLSAGRSVSSSHADFESSTPLMAKKVNVSSGISNRIKALEKLQSREGSPAGPSPAVTVPSSSSSFESLRKRASVSIPSGTLPDFSRAPSLQRNDSRPYTAAARRTSSISMTARSRSPKPSAVEPGSDTPTRQDSPSTVQHDIAKESELPESASQSDIRRASIDSSSSRPAGPLSRSEKKESRASRLMRRMSSMTSSRRNIIGTVASPVKEEGFPQAANGTTLTPSGSGKSLSSAIEIGEVNVQFLIRSLWKRRCIRIDEEGYLVLAPSTNDSAARNMTKRYHLTEFRTPCLPDEDMQEMPNSILLNFLDGSTLQCACESRQGQATVLQTLVEAHKARHS
ncbi:hypothetical protein N7468_001158 [Penicillium chermesinum]|uniref:GPI-anchored cell surface glycoprotein n=1 Tax=Penicillium chermesinum TaxID=63820 RepID=A0A9W9TWI5_9EURO|nr:uncharacterized protein N7468_001158 [Penicillium chermesinum]KAJ5246175.1 hypothetical protein N7468_001158 [Penicillium chermesinum]